MPMLPDSLASLVIETVCVGDDPTLDPRTLKPKPADHQSVGTVAGDLTRAHAVRFGGSAHIRPGFVIEAERLGDCPTDWKPGDRRQDKRQLFPLPAPIVTVDWEKTLKAQREQTRRLLRGEAVEAGPK